MDIKTLSGTASRTRISGFMSNLRRMLDARRPVINYCSDSQREKSESHWIQVRKRYREGAQNLDERIMVHAEK